MLIRDPELSGTLGFVILYCVILICLMSPFLYISTKYCLPKPVKLMNTHFIEIIMYLSNAKRDPKQAILSQTI